MTKHATTHARAARTEHAAAEATAADTFVAERAALETDESVVSGKPTDDVRVHPFAEDKTTRLAPDSAV